MHHNLLAHNDYRNPQISNVGKNEIVNNAVYNFMSKSMSSSDIMGVRVSIDFINNLTKRGPDSSNEFEIVLHPETGAGWIVYVDGNIGPHRPRNSLPNIDSLRPKDRQYVVPDPPFRRPRIKTSSARDAYKAVLAHAGATLPTRDAVDRRIVQGVIHGTGHLIDDPSDVGGWPRLARGRPPRDSDHDGIPDRWERRHGLKPMHARDARRVGPNGYTWLEHYLNSLAAHA